MTPQRILSFINHTKGVAAVETALLFPLLIILFLGGIETMNYLDAKRSVTNAGFSLAQAAGATDVVDSESREEFLIGNDKILQIQSLKNIRVELTGVEKLDSGDMRRDWVWTLTDKRPNQKFNNFKSRIKNNIRTNEGLVVAVVEADYEPLFTGVVPPLSFSAFHAKVPIRRTIALYR